jgi:hypothetical protein
MEAAPREEWMRKLVLQLAAISFDGYICEEGY